MHEHELPLKILFDSEESCDACLSGLDLSTDFTLKLNNEVQIRGKPAIRAAGLATTEILIHAVIAVVSGVSVKVIGDALSSLISKSKKAPEISIGNVVVTSANAIEEAVAKALLQSREAPPPDIEE